MDIIGSREIAERLQVSQELARYWLKKNYFESQIQTPGTGKRNRIKTTKRALLKFAIKHGFPLSPEEEIYLKNLEGNQLAPIGSDKGQEAVRVELCQPLV